MAAATGIWFRMGFHKFKNKKSFFKKGIDKSRNLWYNKGTVKEAR